MNRGSSESPLPPLGQMSFLGFVQHLQPIPRPLAQLEPLLRGPSDHLQKRTFLLCPNRTFSLCGRSPLEIS